MLCEGSIPGRTLAISAGLVWQFVLVLILLARERRGAHRSQPRALRPALAALWLQGPALPGTGVKDKGAWLILIPLMMITAFYQIVIAKHIIRFWTAVFPFFAEPPLFSLSGYLASPRGRAEMAGNWGVFFLYVLCALFNSIRGKAFFYSKVWFNIPEDLWSALCSAEAHHGHARHDLRLVIKP